MTSAAASPRPVNARRRAAVWITVGAVVVLVIAFFIFAGLYTDVLWYGQLGFLEVLTTQWAWGSSMFAIGFLGLAAPLWAAIQLAYRLRPVYAKLNTQLDRYQQVVEPLRRLAVWGVPIVFGLFGGAAAASHWQTAAVWLHAQPSGVKDPQFHLDTSFYMLQLPFYHSITAFVSAALIIAFLATVATAYLYGSIRVSGREVRFSRAARIQIAVVAALYLLVQAISIWLDRFNTLTDANVSGRINGAGYTDVNATIPARTILAGIAVVVAILFVLTAIIGRWRYPLVGTALLIVCAIVIGNLYPWGVQKIKVDPSVKTVEAQYIQRAIDATQTAYNVENVQTTEYQAKTTAEPGALKQDAQTTTSIRLIDPTVVSPAFSQLQQFKQYYGFPSDLDVDRYTVDGKEQDTVVAVRGIDQTGLGDSRNWYNDTLVYTHGYGIVAAAGNTRSADGQPEFVESGIPTTGDLGDYEPRVYFGEGSPSYSIVGAPKSSKPVELDYPAGGGDAGVTYNTYQGDGGPKLSNVFDRLVYALKFQNEQILLSNGVNKDSQILYDRDPAQRVQKVAPYLTLDGNPYPSIVDGRIVWIVDGFTTSDAYPYSKVQSYSDAIADSQTDKSLYPMDDINYIRNSVKATVDAYSGKVTLYAWDPSDPVLKTWEKIFPSTLKPISDMSAQLMAHVRYPEDLFKVQRAVLAQYHVDGSGSFFSNEDAWTVPSDPSKNDNQSLQPPYYLTMQMPGQSAPAYSLYSTYIPQSSPSSSRSVLKGYLAVDSDAGDQKGTVSPDYGKLRLLTVPSEDSVPGPGSVQNSFESDTTVSQQLNVLRLGSTSVKYGNLLTLPVGGGLLYVEPVYVQSTGDTSYPLLQEVLVSFGEKVVMKPTLDEALDELFGGDSGTTAGDHDVTPTDPVTNPGGTDGDGDGSTAPPTSTPTSTPSGSPTAPPTGSASDPAALKQALADANQAYQDSQQALAQGDWTAYGAAQQRLQQAIQKAITAEGSK